MPDDPEGIDDKDLDRRTRGGAAEDGEPLDRRRLSAQPEPVEEGKIPENAPEAAQWRSGKAIGNRRVDTAQGLVDDQPPVE
jgi:hypothetical protein